MLKISITKNIYASIINSGSYAKCTPKSANCSGVKKFAFIMWYNDYMAGGLVCPQLDQNAAYKTPEPITACVAGDGSTVIAYYYEIAKYRDRGTHRSVCRGYDFSEKTDIQTFHRHFIDQMEQPQGRIGSLI